MCIFLCKNRNRYLLILEEFHGQTTVIFEKIGHFARFWLGNSFGASFPVICPWKTTKIDRNMKNKRAYPFIFQYYLNHYFSGHVCLSIVRTSVTKFFFRLNRLGITPWLPGSTPGLTPGSSGARSPSGGARICPRSGHFLVKYKNVQYLFWKA